MPLQSKINCAQKLLQEFQLDGWLLYDFRRSNSLACDFLALESNQLLTRRFFYWIPCAGEPCKLLHAIESHILDSAPGLLQVYCTWQELEEKLQQLLQGCTRVAMEYSPRNAIPYVSKVDAGTIEVIRGFNVEVVSSANILQYFTSQWNEAQLNMHREAAQTLNDIAEETWKLIRHNLAHQIPQTEYSIQQFIWQQIQSKGFETSDAPICAVNANSANPHYTPTKDSSMPIKENDFILIDLWCKKKLPGAVYADITRVAVASATPSPHQQNIFNIVRQAQQTAAQFVKDRFARQQPIQGWEVDQTCRDVINNAGYGAYFIHRTGHNIDECDHGPGAHMDNFETHDDRQLLPRTCFSIEPGIYLPGEFGVRLEYDVFIHSDGRIEITGGEQNEIQTLVN